MPLLPLGTMGAVIGMKGSEADRKQLFDIGLAGPIAGLVLAVPIAWYGIATAEPYYGPEPPLLMHNPWFFDLLAARLHPELPADQIYQSNPFYLAGWLGMLITGLNMMPVSQLDGGHVAYALFGERSSRFFWPVIIGLALIVVYSWLQGAPALTWVLWIFLLMAFGRVHARPLEDITTLDPRRRALAVFTLVLFFLCFVPLPLVALAR